MSVGSGRDFLLTRGKFSLRKSPITDHRGKFLREILENLGSPPPPRAISKREKGVLLTSSGHATACSALGRPEHFKEALSQPWERPARPAPIIALPVTDPVNLHPVTEGAHHIAKTSPQHHTTPIPTMRPCGSLWLLVSRDAEAFAGCASMLSASCYGIPILG